jgi:hypothetical protein
MINQRLGWGIEPDYLALFKPNIYRGAGPAFVDRLINPNFLSVAAVPVTIGLFLLLFWAEARLAKDLPERNWLQRAGFYVCAFLMFYISVSGLSYRLMTSMIRYVFCVHVLLVLAAVHLLTAYPLPRGRWRSALMGIGGATAVVLAVFEMMLVHFFTHGEWVA